MEIEWFESRAVPALGMRVLAVVSGPAGFEWRICHYSPQGEWVCSTTGEYVLVEMWAPLPEPEDV